MNEQNNKKRLIPFAVSDACKRLKTSVSGLLTKSVELIKKINFDKENIKFLNNKKLIRPVAIVVALGIGFTASSMLLAPGYDVYMNGKQVGTVYDKSQFEAMLGEANNVIDELVGSYDRVLYTPSYLYTLSLKSQFTSADDLKRNIMSFSNGVCEAYTLISDGNATVSFKNKADAEEALLLLKESYSGNDAVILNEITYKNEFVPVGSVETASSAYLKLYNVLKIQTSDEVTYTANVPHETIKTESNDIYTGNEQIVTPGEDGSAQVTARVTRVNGVETASETLSSTELKPTVSEEVIVGVRPRPTGVGTGELIAPFYGVITSRFGTREGRNHKGVDLGGALNSDIVAADEGTVTKACYSGDYGNLIILDHKNGMQTYYAHLNAFNVAVGDTVEKGAVIGKLGSTGRSTGPHLHFEVRKNGVPCDPTGYLN